MKKFIARFFIFSLAVTILGAVVGFSTLAYFSFGLPKISSLADYNPPIPSQILASDGTVLAELGKEQREVVPINEIPKLVIDGFLSAEDDSFYEHEGVDYWGVLRALIVNLKAGRVVQGGSTITQQVAKSLLLSSERSITRKIKDFLLAQKIEERFTKEEILHLYLNQVYLGGGFYGVKSAVKGYFGKELEEASVAEVAMIAGLLVAPTRYSPYVNPNYAKKRQRYVLNRMYANKRITKEQYEKALQEKIKFRIRKSSGFKAGHFTDWVRQRVVEEIGHDEFLRGGYKVVTTLDYGLQKVAEKESLQGAKAIDKRQGFKGPLRHIEVLEEKEKFKLNFRKELYREKSQYFVLNDDFEREYEIEFNEEEVQKIEDKKEEWNKEIQNPRYRAGYMEGDRLVDLLEVRKSYEALVTYVDDWARVIYVNIGGVSGIIPYKYFRWAHERSISSDRHWYPYVTKPSTIVKPGDVILVELMDKSEDLLSHVTKSYGNYLDKSKMKKVKRKLRSEKYLLCMLDQEPEAEVALVSIKPQSGEIVSFVGGVDFSKSQFNRAIQSQRQPGSSFKPILFAAALENGFTPASIIIDSPEALAGVDDSLNWKPRNYDGKFKGPITLRNSLEHSRNVPTIKLADQIGVDNVLSFVDRIGFDAELPPDLSIALGSFGVTLKEIVTTYALFPNGGQKVEAKSIVSITDRHGNQYFLNEQNEKPEEEEKIEEEENLLDIIKADEVFADNKEDEEKTEEKPEEEVNPFLTSLNEKQVYDSRLAYIMTNLLKGVVLHGTGRGARDVSHFLGGKTGTTNSYIDAWFLGFSSNLVTGVWTGFDNNETLGWGETGAKAALPVWKEFMRAGIQKYGEHDFKVPVGIINVLIDKETGELAKGGNPNAFMEAFVEGREPTADSNQFNLSDEKSEENTHTFDLLEEDAYYNNQ